MYVVWEKREKRGSLDFHRYTGNIVEPNIDKSGFCSIQFTVTFAGTQNVDR